MDIYNYLMVCVWIFMFILGITRINVPYFDAIQDIFGFLVYLFMDVLFVTLFLILFKKEVQVNIRLLAIVPLLFVFGPLFSLQFVFTISDKYFGVAFPAFSDWITAWGPLLMVVGIFWVILFFSWLLFKRYQGIQQKLVDEMVAKEKMEREREAEKNQLIAQQNEMLEQEVAQRTRELQQSIDTLKATQSQLIQSEKMASLGELTAGIAHEIQNPLNFVNNFSEVSKELIGELVDEAGKGNLDQVKAIATDVVLNLDKVHHHGKRADAIVKGMLQHSRSNSGQKEPTDLNAMADEYVRLAYHGLRAKDKSFNARIDTDYDASLPPVNVVPQDIGRVVLNLLNNAFYAVAEKLRTHPQDYVPTVEVRTTRTEKGIEISVRDNGNGIPESVKDKIFQPFFTTKPAGQGTGLGLSLSYDIVTKGHGGSLTVDSQSGEGTTFTIVLPVG
jgi:signal transduction histidine kinase